MCYFFLNTTLLSADIFESCNAFGSLCCNAGDLCLPDAFCYTTDQSSYTSGYYIGACSDSSFPGPDCATHCGQDQIKSFWEHSLIFLQIDGLPQTLCTILPLNFGLAVSIQLRTSLTVRTPATRLSKPRRLVCQHRLLLH